MKNETPILALTMGDVNGIGPEVLVKALAHPDVLASCRPVVFGSRCVFDEACASAGIGDLSVEVFEAGQSAPKVRPGVVDAEAGRCAMEWVRNAVEWALDGRAAAVVTGPINKVGIHRARYVYQGHTDFIAELCGVKAYRMCLFTDTMRIVHITGHLSLREALDAVTQPRIVESVKIAYEALKQIGFDAPRIAVAGLNPHAGEAGAFGREEIEVIAPAIEAACAAGYPCSGPYPPDTVFKRMKDGEFDLVVAMYHDQGHVPMKLIAMDEGVNVTLGLPIVRTSVDHGTAYEIAGKNIAREQSMCAAIKLAGHMARARSLVCGALCCAFAFASSAQTMTQSKLTLNVGSNPSFIVSGDLNDDGWVDLVTADRGTLSDPREERPANDEVSILMNGAKEDKAGALSFTKVQPSLKTGFAPYAIAIANIDGLKWPDLMVANFMAVRDEDLSLFRNLQQEGIYESHSFSAPDKGLEYFRQTDGEGHPLYNKPGFCAVAVRDLDGDGLRDAVAAAWCSDALAVFKGNAETYFEEPVYYPLAGAPRDVQIQDFDGDGILDIAALLYSTGELSVWKGAKDGVWKESMRFSTRGKLPVRLQSADMNGDERFDLIVAHSHSEDSLVVFYNDADMKFSVSQEILLGEDRAVLEEELRDCSVGDFNGDGRMDMAAACYASSSVKVIMNMKREGEALPHFAVEEYTFGDGRPRAVCTGDFNHDEKLDIAVALWGNNTVGFLLGK